jgi:hypothetical protein
LLVRGLGLYRHGRWRVLRLLRGLLRGLLWRVLRLLWLLWLRSGVLLLRLLAHRSTVLRVSQGVNLAIKNRPWPARSRNAGLATVKGNVELDARLPSRILLILTGVKGSSQLLKQSPGNFHAAIVVGLRRNSLSLKPKRSLVGAVLLLLLLWLVRVHWSTGSG